VVIKSLVIESLGHLELGVQKWSRFWVQIIIKQWQRLGTDLKKGTLNLEP